MTDDKSTSINRKRILICIGIGFVISAVVLVAIIIFSDFHSGHNRAARCVDAEMAQKNVVDFVNLQGLRVYLVYENGSYYQHLFTIGLLNGRYRAWSVDGGVSGSSEMPSRGVRTLYRVTTSGSTLTYEQIGTRLAILRNFAPLLLFIPLFTLFAHSIISRSGVRKLKAPR